MRWGQRPRRQLLFVGLLCLFVTAHAGPPRFAFGVNGEDFSLSTYRVEADGGLRHLGHRPINKAPPMVALDPSGRFVVAVSSTADNLAVFRLNHTTGALSPVPGSPFASGAGSPFSISFHPSGRFVYVGARFSGVGAYAFDQDTGAIKPVPGSPFSAQRRTRAAVVHPSGQYLYAVNAYSNSVSAYRIDADSGALSDLPGSPYAVGDFGEIDYVALRMMDVPPEAGGIPHFIDVDPQGRFVFVPNKATGSVSVFAIDPDNGGLSPVEGSPFFTGFNPYRLRVHPSGRFLFVTLWDSAQLAVHGIDRDSGRLTPVAGSPFSLNAETPVGITFNADGSQVYVSTYDGNEIVLLDVDTDTGKLSLRESLMTRLGPWSLALAEGKAHADTVKQALLAATATGGLGLFEDRQDGLSLKENIRSGGAATAVAVAPNGRFAYAINGADGTLATFAVDANHGTLTTVPNGIVSLGREAADIAIDVNGWYLYTTNPRDNTFSIFYLDPDSGLPKPVRGSPMSSGRRPVAVTLDPAARYAFVVNADSNDISVYGYVNNVSPLLFEARKYGSPFAAGKEPVALAVDPTGHYAYVANAGSDDVSAYRIHRKTGALSALPGSPFKAGRRPLALAVHSNGEFLYVANHDSADITLYRIDTALGAIAPSGKPVKLPLAPQGLWLSPTGDTAYVLADDGKRLLTFSLDPASGALRPRSEQTLTTPITDLTFIP